MAGPSVSWSMMTLRRMKEEKLALRRARRSGSTLGVDYLSLIDRSKLHYKRSDVTPIFAEPAAFAALVDDLLAPWRSEKIDRVVGTDAQVRDIIATAAGKARSIFEGLSRSWSSATGAGGEAGEEGVALEG